MDIIESYKVQLNSKLPMKDVLQLHQIASSSSSNIYLYRNHMIADAENLPKLLSFFLTTDNKETFTLIKDGITEESDSNTIKEFLENSSIKVNFKIEYETSDQESIVI
ncbi:hypothetical protein [Oceanobacillus damuensis]|uniref:hypothetical protein n=1 Tax=Oceanobacillus damuensis TaxID=937928 RepID=UPI0008318370|nr:hypothetical protein [Oceanobacillus damuensis]